MKWEIITTSTEVSGGLDISLTPKNNVIRFAILQFKLNELSRLVSQASKSVSTGVEYCRIYNYNDMDWEDKTWAKSVKGSELEEGEMFLSHEVMGETIIKEALFDKILFDYASKVLDIYESDESLPNGWNDNMKSALKGLKNKLLDDNNSTT